MKIFRNLVLLSFLTIFMTANAYWDGSTGKKKPHASPKSAANCAPASGLEYLDFNNVNALIETGGSMWQNRPDRVAAYEVPKNSGQTSIYSGSLWMGGVDDNDQLKIAAVTFRNGDDFYPGPLTNDRSAEVTPDVCTEYISPFLICRVWL